MDWYHNQRLSFPGEGPRPEAREDHRSHHGGHQANWRHNQNHSNGYRGRQGHHRPQSSSQERRRKSPPNPKGEKGPQPPSKKQKKQQSEQQSSHMQDHAKEKSEAKSLPAKKESRLSLQDYLVNRPGPPHPTEAQLEQLLEGEQLAAGNVYYQKVDGNIVVLSRSKHHSENPSVSNMVFPTDPTMPRADLRNPADTPTPQVSMPDSLRRHDRLFRQPKEPRNLEHGAGGDACHCPSTGLDFSVANFVSDVCLQKNYTKPEQHIVNHKFSVSKCEPNKRAFLYSAQSRRPVLQVPAPFAQAWAWPPLTYLPANARDEPSRRLDLFYTLHRPDLYCSARKPYMTAPSQWDATMHPCWSEPSQADELYLWSKELYGSETLLRTQLARHPARDNHLRIYSAMDQHFTVPVLKGGLGPTAIEDFLRTALRPFYHDGCGRIVCAVCILEVRASQFRPLLFTRSEFIAHARQEHVKNVHVLGLSFSTQYNSRLYEVVTLYMMSLAHGSEAQDDKPEAHPFSEDGGSFISSKSEAVRSMLMKTGHTKLVELGLRAAAPQADFSSSYAQPKIEEVTLSGDEEESCSSSGTSSGCSSGSSSESGLSSNSGLDSSSGSDSCPGSGSAPSSPVKPMDVEQRAEEPSPQENAPMEPTLAPAPASASPLALKVSPGKRGKAKAKNLKKQNRRAIKQEAFEDAMALLDTDLE